MIIPKIHKSLCIQAAKITKTKEVFRQIKEAVNLKNKKIKKLLKVCKKIKYFLKLKKYLKIKLKFTYNLARQT